MSLGDRIRKAREAKGWEQHDLAHEVGVEPPTVSRWENNVIRPRPRKLKEIAKRTGKAIEWLLGDGSDLTAIQRRLEKLEQEKVEKLPIPPDLLAAWENAEPEMKLVARWMLTGDDDLLEDVADQILKKIKRKFEVLSLSRQNKSRP